MMKLFRASALLVVMLSVMAAAARAQTGDSDVPKPDLSGTWRLNIDKSNLGGLPAPLKLIETISQSGASEITFHVQKLTDKGETKYHYTLQIGGKETAIPINTFSPTDEFQIQNAQASWAADSLVVTINATYRDAPWTMVAHYTLTPDGKRLTKAIEIDKDSGPGYMVEIYDKD